MRCKHGDTFFSPAFLCTGLFLCNVMTPELTLCQESARFLKCKEPVSKEEEKRKGRDADEPERSAKAVMRTVAVTLCHRNLSCNEYVSELTHHWI